MKTGDPLKAWSGVPVKAYVQLSDKEKSKLKRIQIMILTWSILGSFTYALIWYWVPSVDSFIGKQFALTSFEIGLLISSFGAAFGTPGKRGCCDRRRYFGGVLPVRGFEV
jgi:hypothetical protein